MLTPSIGLRRSEREIERGIRWLGERHDVIQVRTLYLVRKVDCLSDDQADRIAISELQPLTATNERVQSLSQDVEHVQDVLDVDETDVFELRYTVDAYPREQVDTLRVKVDGLHRGAETMSQTALQDARAEIQDLRTRLSASEMSEMSLITRLLRMEERISALEQRPLGQQKCYASSKIGQDPLQKNVWGAQEGTNWP
ncbi:hypothetical protein Tco_0482602 [Tanacetum coccineum]